MRWVTAGLAVILLLLQYALWFGEGGLIELWRLEEAVATQRAENTELRQRNVTLEAEVKDLKSGLEAVEERARGELGMIRDGEVFYQVVEE
ncbi:cell division protein FtsB [Alkalilimnicola sp. S0819]|uniref:cell division protein FtsB n=1 Tax=Alkalilimnicola sp. S0819 TaxID=2613922 RepID=UPI0012625272|nr:cell division protein FtsB [Alkalilimnicola sp. S0819]KAB7627941.1 cell division protein FtsB [Alkalilimnicola sp. S0819]MPQ15579.1 cell division protein FtsB [Alkalilimnicola sp. S0819]